MRRIPISRTVYFCVHGTKVHFLRTEGSTDQQNTRNKTIVEAQQRQQRKRRRCVSLFERTCLVSDVQLQGEIKVTVFSTQW